MMADTGSSAHDQDSSAQPARPSASEGQSRVCDTCRIRKCKCSNERPTCASCRDNGWTCTYSLKRKRPGPVPGSRRKKPTDADVANVKDPETGSKGETNGGNSLSASNLTPSNSTPSATSTPLPPKWGQSGSLPASQDANITKIAAQFGACRSQSLYKELTVTRDQALAWFSQNIENLLTLYFDSTDACYSFIDFYTFDDEYRDGRVPRYLLLAMSALAIRFMPREGKQFVDNKARVEMALHLAHQAREDLHENCNATTQPELSEVQATFLLTVFECTRRPGRRTWETAGALARMAYRAGLHAVDEAEQQSESFQRSHSSLDQDLKRRMIWCIYRLDTYAGIVTGTAFNINVQDIATRLPQRPDGVEDVYLTNDVTKIWKSFWIREEPCSTITLRNMYLISSSLVRESSTLTRLIKMGQPHESIVENIQRNWHFIRQNTPAWFWDPQMDPILETSEGHRLRLEINFQFHLLELAGCFDPLSLIPRHKSVERYDMDEETRWQSIVSVAERVAANFRQWKRTYFAKAEPFACFWSWMATVVFNLERCRLSNEDVMARSYFEHLCSVMEVALSEFGFAWELATTLSTSLETVKALTSNNLPAQVLLKIMAGCFAPLNAKQSILPPGVEVGSNYLAPVKTTDWSGATIDPVSESQLLNLPDEIINFSFQSPFLDGLAEEWHFAFR